MNWTRDLLDSYTKDKQAERIYNETNIVLLFRMWMVNGE